MSIPAIRIENLGKLYRLGDTHSSTLSDRLADGLRGLTGRRRPKPAVDTADFWALRDVNLELPEGEALGIIGGNGAGKSTLLKILSRITPPTTGRALVRGRLASLLEVGTGFHPELTGRENVFLNGTILGMRKAEVARKFDEIVAFAGVEQFIDTPVKRYSSGMYVRLAFAVAAHLEPDVLIVDEVLAVGDAGFQKRCLGKMDAVAKAGRTVLFVSHNMAAIQKLCSTAVWMEQGRSVMHGAAEGVVAAYLNSVAETLGDEQGLPPGYLYRTNGAAETGDAFVCDVQSLSVRGGAMSSIGTWDDVVFRIGFKTRRAFPSFAVEICFSTPEGIPLILSSTTPDNQMAFSVDVGRYEIECTFPQFALSAGDYLVGIRLTVPWVEYIWRHDALCKMHVAPRDVFNTGLPPAGDRYRIAVPNRWDAPTPLTLETEQVAAP